MSTGDPLVFNQGQAGQYLTAGDGITVSGSGSWQSLDLNLPDNKDFIELKGRIEGIEQRLAIVVPNEALQARFPALQEAYNHYKLIEKLVNDQA
jgi:hypothetical protein